jgi:hypothetical protein
MDVALRIISFFPIFFDEEENQTMYSDISKEMLQEVISSFQKDKIPRLDGWMTKFFE